MSNIKTKTININQKTGIWYYAGELLKKYGLRNLGSPQYKLFIWLEEQNKSKIKDQCISANTLLSVPSCRNDIIQICYSEIKTNENNTLLIDEDYCIYFESSIKIYQSAFKPGVKKDLTKKFDDSWNVKAEDLDSNDKEDSEILKQHEYFQYTISERSKIIKTYTPLFAYKINEPVLISEMRDLFHLTTLANETMRNEIINLLNHFIDGTGEEYIFSKKASDYLKRQKTVKDYLELLKKSFLEELEEIYFDLEQYKIINVEISIHNKSMRDKMQEGKNISFDEIFGFIDGTKIAIHDTQGNIVKLSNSRIENDIFKGTLEIDIYDHFGLDANDIKKFGSIAGFRAWYYLQHAKYYKGKYKPFITHLIILEEIEEAI